MQFLLMKTNVYVFLFAASVENKYNLNMCFYQFIFVIYNAWSTLIGEFAGAMECVEQFPGPK